MCQQPGFNNCQNGATCVNPPGTTAIYCVCKPGFTGNNCGINIDECASNPCANGGSCIDGVNNYTCVCRNGFTGKNCENEINECNSRPCKNNATCIDLLSGYECKCKKGFRGTDCELKIDCQSQPCQNGGKCADGIDAYKCACPLHKETKNPAWEGDNCEKDVNECLKNPCLHGGTCINIPGDFRCKCKPLIHGKKMCNVDCSTYVVLKSS